MAPYPPLVSVPMWEPACKHNKVWKYSSQIPNPYSHSTSTFHDSDPMEDILECFMKPTMKTNFSISQYDIIAHNLNLESNLDTCYPIQSISYDSFPLNLPTQSLPNIRNEQVQGSQISH